MLNKTYQRFSQILQVLSRNEKKQVLTIFFLSFIGIFLDLFGIGIIFPIMDIIINDEETFLSKFELYNNFFDNKSKNDSILLIISFLIFFVFKTLFSTFVIWYEKDFTYNYLQIRFKVIK